MSGALTKRMDGIRAADAVVLSLRPIGDPPADLAGDALAAFHERVTELCPFRDATDAELRELAADYERQIRRGSFAARVYAAEDLSLVTAEQQRRGGAR